MLRALRHLAEIAENLTVRVMRTEAPEKILVIRHEQCASVGLLGRVLNHNGIPFTYLDTPEGNVLTEPVTDYSHIIVLGGAISAYEDDRYSFLRYEFKLLEAAITQQIPIVGICLGSQILARVLGANVYRGEAGREAGWCYVHLTEAAATDPLLKPFPPQFQVFQSHQDTFDIPPDCTRLASSDKYPNQSFRYHDHVWAIQFHLEIDEHVLSDCSAVIEQELIDSQIQDTSMSQLLEDARQHSPVVAPLADRFMQQFLQIQPGIATAQLTPQAISSQSLS